MGPNEAFWNTCAKTAHCSAGPRFGSAVCMTIAKVERGRDRRKSGCKSERNSALAAVAVALAAAVAAASRMQQRRRPMTRAAPPPHFPPPPPRRRCRFTIRYAWQAATPATALWRPQLGQYFSRGHTFSTSFSKFPSPLSITLVAFSAARAQPFVQSSGADRLWSEAQGTYVWCGH